MKGWIRRIRAAVGMGVTWAAGWAPVGVVISLVMEAAAGLPLGSITGLWVMSVSVFGFIGGTIFSMVLRLMGGRKRFDELSLPGFAAWGALGGLALGAVAVAAGLVGSGFTGGIAAREIVILVTTTVLSSASAAGTLALARMSEDHELLSAGDRVSEVGLSEGEVKALLGK